jgi:hypothetical protein
MFNATATIHKWINVLFLLVAVQSIIVTGLISYRIWSTNKNTANFRGSQSKLLPILRILLESAALQAGVEILLLILFALDVNAQLILVELVTPLIVSVVS